jgi:diguanylate cyclase (GGDEF)-like protein
MNGLDTTTSVVWYGHRIPPRLPRVLNDWEFRHAPSLPDSSIPTSVDLSQIDLAVVEGNLFPNLRDWRRFAAEQTRPTLWIGSRRQVAEFIRELSQKDDLCTTDSPLSILVTRLSKLRFAQLQQIDSLTGVRRREGILDYLRAWAVTPHPSRALSLILADVDHFQEFNDRWGIDAGDDALQEFGRLLRRTAHESPMIARWGGQQFALVLLDEESVANRLAERICEETSSKSHANGRKFSVSLGVASLQQAGNCQRLLQLAEEALFAAKAKGRNRVECYESLQTTSVLEGDDLDLIGLENRSRVLAERITSFVAERRRTILQNLRREADTDGLTEFFTRRYLDRRLECQLRRANAQDERLTIALIDLDHFGQINKQFGWPTGDKVLRDISRMIRNNLRSTDWVGRYGGEEFCVVMHDTSAEQAAIACERLRVMVAQETFRTTSAESICVTLSVGIAECSSNDLHVSHLIERASQQTLHAKNSGRNRVCA